MHGNQLCGFEIKFQSTLPARGATVAAIQYQADCRISIHAPRTGSDLNFFSIFNSSSYFNPRSPHGERRFQIKQRVSPRNFNPRSPHGERPPQTCVRNLWRSTFQSTLPARGATEDIETVQQIVRISIHAPRTGSDRQGSRSRETARYFNPRSPHGERLLMALSTATMINISIHAPRTGSDRYRAGRYNPAERISIHAPRTGSDGITAALTTRSGLFQSTLPARGATRRAFAGTGQRFLFQSTLPARGATHRRRPP